MAANEELMDKIRKAESEYGSSDKWPDSIVEELNRIANRLPDITHTENVLMIRRMIQHGFDNYQIVEARKVSIGHVRHIRLEMTRAGELNYEATPDELTQLKYNVKHMNRPNNKGVASVMGRDKDWVHCMREKLREAEK
ncbi:hypothetical protein [Levilactobacillus brevis]|uniref:hypothetical protein n=1 Tax=Levilactobacillus brevis TaxID=1580 RepID=UPI00063ADDA8|nr:hypothetical protein [Levilactobacillus brevis]KLE30786.1 hypothetical protein AAX72_02055 [Levilactobacillus brevis]MCT3569112.1 hypothetical protein [Levilactobacillus brevis]MCT3578683.1 hypothetical protein [Levilactobacillus brevis]